MLVKGEKNPMVCFKPADSFDELGPGPCWENNYSIVSLSITGVILRWSSVLS